MLGFNPFGFEKIIVVQPRISSVAIYIIALRAKAAPKILINKNSGHNLKSLSNPHNHGKA